MNNKSQRLKIEFQFETEILQKDLEDIGNKIIKIVEDEGLPIQKYRVDWSPIELDQPPLSKTEYPFSPIFVENYSPINEAKICKCKKEITVADIIKYLDFDLGLEVYNYQNSDQILSVSNISQITLKQLKDLEDCKLTCEGAISLSKPGVITLIVEKTL